MARSRPYTCGLDAAIDVVGGKWKATIVWTLEDQGPLRFGELKRAIPAATEKMLIQQLRELEADGLVHREVYQQVPPKVEYSLTDYGRTLEVALRPLGDWGHANMAHIEATHV